MRQPEDKSFVESAKEAGRSYGGKLGDFATGLKEVEAWVSREISGSLNSARGEIARLEADLESLKLAQEEVGSRRTMLTGNWQAIVTRREGVPAQFSLVRGLIYISLSFLLILADISILGQVIARFLGYNWRNQQGLTFAQLILSSPLRAFREFPDLLCLTLALLLMGLFVKVWRDSYLNTLSENPRRIDRAEFRLYSSLLCMAALAIIMMAAARLTLDVGSSQGTFTRIVSAFLGLALPFVGAGFFIKGYDSLAERFELWRLSYQRIIYYLANRRYQRQVKRTEGQLEAKNSLEKELSSQEYCDAEFNLVRGAFSQGYREGLGYLFSGVGLAERVRPVLVARILSGKGVMH
jgi:hypothetical protein